MELAQDISVAGDWPSARSYVVRALNVKDDPERYETLRLAGRVLIFSPYPKDKAFAIKSFSDSYHSLDGRNEIGVGNERATILHDWIPATIVVADCADTQLLIGKFAAITNDPTQNPSIMRPMKTDELNLLARFKGCSLNTTAIQ